MSDSLLSSTLEYESYLKNRLTVAKSSRNRPSSHVSPDSNLTLQGRRCSGENQKQQFRGSERSNTQQSPVMDSPLVLEHSWRGHLLFAQKKSVPAQPEASPSIHNAEEGAMLENLVKTVQTLYVSRLKRMCFRNWKTEYIAVYVENVSHSKTHP